MGFLFHPLFKTDKSADTFVVDCRVILFSLCPNIERLTTSSETFFFFFLVVDQHYPNSGYFWGISFGIYIYPSSFTYMFFFFYLDINTILSNQIFIQWVMKWNWGGCVQFFFFVPPPNLWLRQTFLMFKNWSWRQIQKEKYMQKLYFIGDVLYVIKK